MLCTQPEAEKAPTQKTIPETIKAQNEMFRALIMVAGAGFEPATFGL